MTATTNPAATEILDLVDELGARLSISADKEMVTVNFTFEPGDNLAYITAESNALRILALFPMNRPGSVWGTDSASVGGHAGLTGGYVRMNKSGVAKRLAGAVLKARLGRRTFNVAAEKRERFGKEEVSDLILLADEELRALLGAALPD